MESRGDVKNGSGAEVKEKYRQLYDGLSKHFSSIRGTDYSNFLNFGYKCIGGLDEARFNVPDGIPGGDSIRLVYELVGSVELEGRALVDVGCGRGGPAALLSQRFGADVLGVDLSPEAVSYCRKANADLPIRFEVGDAEALPVADSSVDVVTNIESSHTYPNMPAFLSEVRRILRPGGWFLHTDMLSAYRWVEIRKFLDENGFVLETDREITESVLASRDAVRRYRGGNGRMHPMLENILGLPGSEIYELMKDGTCEYRIFRSRLKS